MASHGAPQAGPSPFWTASASTPAHPSLSLPRHPSSSAGHHTYGTQSSSTLTGALSPGIDYHQSQSSNLVEDTQDTLMGDDAEPHVNAGPSTPPSNLEEVSRFPYLLYRVMQDRKMSECIVWYEDEEKEEHGIFIPDIYVFVLYVLPKYFPNMSTWDSFHRQLSNYEFEKIDRDRKAGIFVHCENNFRQGRKDLLPKVVHRSTKQKPAPPQHAVQEQQATLGSSSAPDNVPQPTDPGNDRALIEQLMGEVNNLKTNQDKLDAENTRLRDDQNQLRDENRHLQARVSKLEEARAHHYPAINGRLGELEQDEEMNGSQNPTLDDGSWMVRPTGTGTFDQRLPPPSQTHVPGPVRVPAYTEAFNDARDSGRRRNAGITSVPVPTGPGTSVPSSGSAPAGRGPRLTQGASAATDDVAQLVGPESVCDWVITLLREFLHFQTNRENVEKELREEIAVLKKRQATLQAENDRLKGGIGKWVLQACDSMNDQSRVEENRIQSWETNMKQGVWSIGDGSSHSTIQPGSRGLALGDPQWTATPSGPDTIGHVPPPPPQNIQGQGGNALTSPDRPEIHPASFSQQPRSLHTHSYDATAPVMNTVPHCGVPSTYEGSLSRFYSTDEPAGSSAQLFEFFDPTAGSPSQDVPELLHILTSAQAVNGAGTSARRENAGLAQVPPASRRL